MRTSIRVPNPEATVTDPARIDQMLTAHQSMRREIARRIVGQDDVIEEMLIALFAGGHVLLEGVPGLAKTLLISSLARVMDLSFGRIQFTPDLMPADITGSEILEEDQAGHREFRFVPGPVFHNVILADEINRTPPKTQAALLQAMQEKQVTAAGQTHTLEAPFFVLATQNPIEQEGTYPLPEAQLDRFMFNVLIGYPDLADEVRIVESTTGVLGQEPAVVLGREDVLDFQALAREVQPQEQVTRHAVALARATRVGTDEAAGAAREYLAWGAGPRAAQDMVRGAKTRALLDGRETPSLEDVRRLAAPVLRHRLVTNFHAEAENVAKDTIIARILDEVPA
ncbi:AAA domain-containing protein [bacterium]|nr:AAA domain-containing protein [bacterium]